MDRYGKAEAWTLQATAEEAASWLYRLDRGEDGVERGFAQWVMRSRRHVREALFMWALRSELKRFDWARLPLSASPARACRRWTRTRRTSAVIGMAILAAAAAAMVIHRNPTIASHRNPEHQGSNLVFTGQSVGQAVAEFNRHNATQLVVADPAIANWQFSGVFPASDPDLFAAALAESLQIQVVLPQGQEVIRLERRKEPMYR